MLQYVDTLFKAYLRGDLVTQNCKKCAAGQIVKAALGYEDSRWWEVMLAFAQGKQTLEDELYAAFLKRETGLSIEDFHRIDAAFEGAPYVPGESRKGSDEDMASRLDRVLDVLSGASEEKCPRYEMT